MFRILETIRGATGSLAGVAVLATSLPLVAGSTEAAGVPRAADVAAEEISYQALQALPSGSTDASRDGVEATAIALADTLAAVPLGEGLETTCPTPRLEVQWSEPDLRYEHGAFVTPLGPAPDAGTDEVNGIVVCRDAAWAYMGFEARFVDGRWDVVAVPYLGGEGQHGEEPANLDADPEHAEPAEQPSAPSGSAPSPAQGPVPAPAVEPRDLSSSGIEGYAAYEPQRTCSPTAKPGTLALRNLLIGRFSGSNLGIARGCSVGGRSEHKEGRAFDWGVNVNNPSQKAAADSFVSQLLATDSAGNRHAMARRMGVMYVIWNKRIWSSYRADQGWRPYGGASAHTDHVHISLSWAGAQGRTSWWSGTVADVGTLHPVGGGGTAAVALGAATPTSDDDDDDRRVEPSPMASSPAAQAERRALPAEYQQLSEELAARLEQVVATVPADQRWTAAEQEFERWRSERVAAGETDAERELRHRAERRALRQATEEVKRLQREQWAAAKAEERARHEADREARRQARAEEKVRRQAEREAAREEHARLKAERKTEREARRAAEREAEAQARAARRAEREAAKAERQAHRAAERQARAEAKAQAKAEREAKRAAERQARAEAKAQAKAEREARRAAERQARAEARAQAKADREAKRAAEREARAQAKAEARAKKEAEREARRKAREEERARRRAEREARREAASSPAPTESAPESSPEPTETASATESASPSEGGSEG